MKKTVLIILLVLLTAMPLTAAAEPYETYTYSYLGKVQVSPHAYHPAGYINFANKQTGALSSPKDIFYKDGLIYIADTGNNRVLVFNEDWELLRKLDTFSNKGREDELSGPQGVFVTGDGELYVADTMNARILCFNPDCTLRTEIGVPDSKLITEDMVYRPVALAVDVSKRLYVVSNNVNMGVMVMDKNGRFYGFIGAQKVTVSLLDLFWRRFMTAEQKARTKTIVPTEYNNITIDRDGFLFVTTNTINGYAQYSAAISKSRSADFSPIKKMNSAGTDILPRNGFYPPSGDLEVEFGYGSSYGPSSFIEVALGENGVFSMADSRKNKIFTYDEDGKLLYIFGGTGSQIGVFQSLASITYAGSRMLCLDGETGFVTVFDRTEYGDLINQAIEAYNQKKFGKSSELWASLADYNGNLDLAYMGLADSCYRNGDYEKAMEYYKKTVNTAGYSKAYKAARKDWLDKYFLLVIILAVGAIAGIYYLFKWIAKKNRAGDYKSGKFTLPEQLLYAVHTVFHPFNGMDEIKLRGRGGVLSATIIMGLAVVASVFKDTASGYIFIGQSIQTFRLGVSALSLIIPIMIWCTASWCLTSLMDGEGSFKNIYVSTCYSLTPMILIYFPITLLSNLFTSEEAAFYTFFCSLAIGWTLALIFFGTLVIHDYSLTKNVVTVILAVIGMMVIIFLGVLFFNLIQKIIAFVANLAIELTYRI